MSQVKNVSGTEFKSLIADEQAVLVDFWAEWCGPCKMMNPVLETIAEQFGEKVTIAKVDVDNEQELASEFGVMSIPTLILFKDGDAIERFTGYIAAEDLAGKLEQAL